MSSKKKHSTILIVDQQLGKTQSLTVKTKHILRFKYYISAFVLVVFALGFATILLFNKVNNHTEEKRTLLLEINDLKRRIPQLKDTVQAKNYIQSIENKLKKINEYLRKRGVPGFSANAVGGNNKVSENLSIEENYSLFEDHIEKIFAGLVNTPMGFPSKPAMTSSYGYRNDPFHSSRADFHAGLDFKGNKGDPVRSTADGVIIHAGWYQGYGNCVKIAHKAGFETLYGHLSKIEVEKGQKVSANQLVGLIGSTGHSTGNHLHYEVRKNNKPINPTDFLSLN